MGKNKNVAQLIIKHLAHRSTSFQRKFTENMQLFLAFSREKLHFLHITLFINTLTSIKNH